MPRLKREIQHNFLIRQRDEQLRFERQLEQKAELLKASNAPLELPSGVKQSIKLPKLVITKYIGALQNRLLFWNRFEAEIDSVDLPTLKKARKGIVGLSFATEGYDRAKHIFSDVIIER